MFESLAEQIRHDEQGQVSRLDRTIRWIAIAVLSVVIFGAIFYGVQFLQ